MDIIKKIVNYLAEKLKEKKAETQILTAEEANSIAMPEADIYIFSAAAEAFNINQNMRIFMKNLTDMKGKKYGVINTHAMNKDRFYKTEKLLSKKQMVNVASVECKVGKALQSGNAFIDGWEAKIDIFAAKLS